MEGVSYEWMHPSWRDLVIEHLIQKKSERRHFISRCGLNGILLAISFAGGAEGLKKYPLLVDKEDWCLFEARIEKFLENSELTEDIVILSSVKDLLRELSHTEDVALENMKKLAAKAISACREKWDSRKVVISNRLLSNYSSISEFIKPLPPYPDLEATWAHIIAIENFDLNEYFDLRAFSINVDKWADLLDIILKNEPRFFKQQPLQEIIDSRLGKIISELSSFDLEEYREISTNGELEDYLDELECCAGELYGLRVCLIRLIDIFQVKSEKIRNLNSLVEDMGDRRNKLEEKYDYLRYQDEEDNEQEWHKIPYRNSETFDIDALFKDL